MVAFSIGQPTSTFVELTSVYYSSPFAVLSLLQTIGLPGSGEVGRHVSPFILLSRRDALYTNSGTRLRS